MATESEAKYTLRIRHGGSISKSRVPKYVGGHVEIFKNMDYDEWGMMTIKDKVQNLGYSLSNELQVFWFVDHELKEFISDEDAWDQIKADELPTTIEIWVVDKSSDKEQEASGPTEVRGNEIITTETEENLINSTDEDSLCDSSEEDGSKSKPHVFKASRDMDDPPLCVGLVFATKKLFKKAMVNYSLKYGKELKFFKNDKLRMYAMCTKEGCPWRINIQKEPDNKNFRVTYFHNVHDTYCLWNNHNKLATSTVVSKRWAKELKFNPKWTPSEYSQKIGDSEGVYLRYKKAFYCLQKAKAITHGDEEAEFRKLWGYCEEVQRTNPKSTVIVKCVDDEDGFRRFQRLFMCWEACREGFKYCRKIIGLDGTHLSGKLGGVLLTAIGLDGNESIFPLAYAVVESENYESWIWLAQKHPSEWSKSHFDFNCKSDTNVNNFCKSFNHVIKEARQKPMIQCLEAIREELTVKFFESKERAEKWRGPICPNIAKKLAANAKAASRLTGIKCHYTLFEIRGYHGHVYEQHEVDLDSGTCSCRMWSLTGIPCRHAICAISLQRQDLRKPIEQYVDKCYSIENYKQAYSGCLRPIRGMSEWPESSKEPPLPPLYMAKPGRPRKLRRKSQSEVIKTFDGGMKEKPKRHCSKCKQPGHNLKRCPEDPAARVRMSQPKKKKNKQKATSNCSQTAGSSQTSADPATQQDGYADWNEENFEFWTQVANVADNYVNIDVVSSNLVDSGEGIVPVEVIGEEENVTEA